eukprot:783059-Amphidinium_carterae.1
MDEGVPVNETIGDQESPGFPPESMGTTASVNKGLQEGCNHLPRKVEEPWHANSANPKQRSKLADLARLPRNRRAERSLPSHQEP